MRRGHSSLQRIALCCGLLLALSACTNKSGGTAKKGQRQILLSTEYHDARLGAEASQSVAAQMGVLDDPVLHAYVNEIGRKLLRGLPRRSFKYEFSVIDQWAPNAFALPGGYIFISRGLLALANSEDELACVIGHEITHADRRHSAAQQELGRRGSFLKISPAFRANVAAYGRDMEREADKGGQILAAAAGYDPMGMSTFLANLGQVERLAVGHSRMRSFLDTHPGSQERAAANAVRAIEIRWQRDPALGDVHSAHLRRIDGMALEQRPEAGLFVGDRFLHPDLDFQLRFPSGWPTSNSNQTVGASSPKGDAVVFLTADTPEGDPELVATQFLEAAQQNQKIEQLDSRPVKVGHLDAWRLEVKASESRGSMIANITFIPYRGATWRVTGMSRSSDAEKYRGRLLGTARSFRPLTQEERAGIRSSRMRIATAKAGEGFAALAKRTGNAWDPGTTAVYNGVFVDHRYRGGELVKLARIERYVPPDAP